MGSYINLKLADPSKVVEVNEFIKETPEGEQLRENYPSRLPVFEANPSTGMYAVGETQLKLSGHIIHDGLSIKQLWADLLRRVHDEYDVRVLHSYPLESDREYLTDEQRAAITDDGNAVEGARLSLAP